MDAVKIYDAFESSEVTGKRDFQRLREDKEDYYTPYDDKHFFKIDFPVDGVPVKKIVSKVDVIHKKYVQ